MAWAMILVVLVTSASAQDVFLPFQTAGDKTS
jgi:hypothetical protein